MNIKNNVWGLRRTQMSTPYTQISPPLVLLVKKQHLGHNKACAVIDAPLETSPSVKLPVSWFVPFLLGGKCITIVMSILRLQNVCWIIQEYCYEAYQDSCQWQTSNGSLTPILWYKFLNGLSHLVGAAFPVNHNFKVCFDTQKSHDRWDRWCSNCFGRLSNNRTFNTW